MAIEYNLSGKICFDVASYAYYYTNNMNCYIYEYLTDDDGNILLTHQIPYNETIYFNYKGDQLSILSKCDYIQTNEIIELLLTGSSKNIIEEFINDACNYCFNYLMDRYNIIYYHIENINMTIKLKNKIILDNVYINNDIKTTLTKDIEHFYKSETLYKKLNIPYKKTYLFHGNENSVFNLACAYSSLFNKKLVIFDFNKLPMLKSYNKNFLIFIQNIPKKIDISEFLNGFYDINGIIIFICINNLHHMQKTIFRICDYIFEIKNLDEILIKKIYKDILNDDNYNEFYNKVKHLKLDVTSLQQFLLKPKELQNIEDLVKIVKLRDETEHSMFM